MRSIVILLTAIMTTHLMAETLGNLEYSLPKVEHTWKVATQLEGNEKRQGATIIYIPENLSKADGRESFTVQSYSIPNNSLDQLKNSFLTAFPNQHVEFTILESDSTSTLFEVIVGKEPSLMYALGRAFVHPTESAILMYETQNTALFETNKAACIQALKEAKLKQAETQQPTGEKSSS